jgi:signal recognition particle subunit SRP54
MGDVVSLAKDFEKHVDEKEAEDDMKRMLKGSFSFDDFIKQINMMRKMGSFQSIVERIPFMQDMLPQGAKVDEREFVRFESMVYSMTKQERRTPELLVKQKSRRERVARGSGRSIAELDQLIQRFMMMRQMVSSLPMFKQMNRLEQIQKNYGNMPKDMMSLFNANPEQSLYGAASLGSTNPRSKQFVKQKKDKRKQQKLARKKSKKRK